MHDTNAWFGQWGGAYVAPPLVPVLRRLEHAFAEAAEDPNFQNDLDMFLTSFAGRPTPLRRLHSAPVACRIVVKREDLAASGGSYVNAAAGQCLLAQRMGAKTVICDTGSGHNGVATAAVAAALGLKCIVFMGAQDRRSRRVMVARMKALGADVRAADAGDAILSEAVSAAYQAWMAGGESTFYVSGAPVGPAPYPAMVHHFQRTVGAELTWQISGNEGRQPDVLVASLGGGSSVLGLFSAYRSRAQSRLVVAQALGPRADHAALRLEHGRAGVLHGARTLVLQDGLGHIQVPPSPAAGLRYPAVAPEVAGLWDEGRIESAPITNDEAVQAQSWLARKEGILASLESCHGLAAALKLGKDAPAHTLIVTVLSQADDVQMRRKVGHVAH